MTGYTLEPHSKFHGFFRRSGFGLQYEDHSEIEVLLYLYKKHGKFCRFDKNIVVVLNDMIFLCVLSCPVMAHCFDANSLPQALHCLDLSQMV